jgi:hypothetical protein
LSDAEVFQKPPGAVGHGRDGAVAKFGRNAGHSFVELEMSAPVAEKVEQVFAK